MLRAKNVLAQRRWDAEIKKIKKPSTDFTDYHRLSQSTDSFESHSCQFLPAAHPSGLPHRIGQSGRSVLTGFSAGEMFSRRGAEILRLKREKNLPILYFQIKNWPHPELFASPGSPPLSKNRPSIRSFFCGSLSDLFTLIPFHYQFKCTKRNPCFIYTYLNCVIKQ